MFEGIRNFIGWHYLRKDLSKLHVARKIINLLEAKKIGIVYFLQDVPVYETISALVTSLQKDNKEVKALGFVKNKELINRFLPKLAYDFFSPKDISFFYKPFSSKVNDFVAQEFDILIDLSMKDQLPLKYICGLSRAHCRIGRYSAETLICYDLMLDAEAGMDLEDYIKQIVHYLTIINRNEEPIK